MSAPDKPAAATGEPIATAIHLPPHIWGPIFWSTLHIASLGYSDTPTERQRKNAAAFYAALVDMLPCPICRNHYEQNLEEMPVTDAVYRVCHRGLSVDEAVALLLGRRTKAE